MVSSLPLSELLGVLLEMSEQDGVPGDSRKSQ